MNESSRMVEIPLPEADRFDRIMTIHAAKGLEFIVCTGGHEAVA